MEKTERLLNTYCYDQIDRREPALGRHRIVRLPLERKLTLRSLERRTMATNMQKRSDNEEEYCRTAREVGIKTGEFSILILIYENVVAGARPLPLRLAKATPTMVEGWSRDV